MPLQVKRVHLQLRQNGQDANWKDGDLLFNTDAQAWARGKRNGVTIEDSNIVNQNSPSEHNNAKYYSEQAANFANNAVNGVLNGNLAHSFDKTQSYQKGDYVMYAGQLWCFTQNHSGDWIGVDAQNVVISDIINGLNGDINYTEMKIKSFTISPDKAEVGSTVNSVTLTYELNQSPYGLKLNNEDITKAISGSIIQSGSYTTNTSWTLWAINQESLNHDAVFDQKSVTLSFVHKVYYGSAELPQNIDETFIKGLANKPLSATRARTVDYNVTANKYAWYAIPTSYVTRPEDCKFSYGGFTGGFEPGITISITNQYNETTDYYVYRSTNHSLGSVKISIS